jgi:hypothetical protein
MIAFATFMSTSSAAALLTRESGLSAELTVWNCFKSLLCESGMVEVSPGF